MIRKQTLWHLFSLFLLAVLLLGCRGGEEPEVEVVQPAAVPPTPTTAVSQQTIRVGVSPDIPPFMFPQDNGLAGFDYDLINLLAPNFELPLEFVEIHDWAKAYDGLVADQYDIVISAASINPNSEAAIQFTMPYFTTGQAAITLANSSVQSVADLDQAVIAVQSGTTGEQWVRANLDAEVRGFNSLEAALTAVQSGEADAAIYDHIPAADYIDIHNNTSLEVRLQQLTQESYGIAMRQGDTAMLNQLNSSLQAFMDTPAYLDLCQTWGIAPGCNPDAQPVAAAPTVNETTVNRANRNKTTLVYQLK